MSLDEAQIRNMVRRVLLRTLGPDGVVDSAAVQASGATGSPQSPAASRPAAGRPLRQTVTEADVLAVPAGGRLVVTPGAMITPLALDTALDRRVEIAGAEGSTAPPAASRSSTPRPAPVTRGTPGRGPVALGADHGGYALKEELKGYLAELGYQVTDCGTHGTASVDYPDFAYAVARLVADERAWRGIIVDGAGIGSCMAANKVPGVRAAMCYDHATAVNSREHNDANVLTLGGGLVGGALARQIVKAWLETEFGGGRHARRVNKIMEIERRFSRGAA